VVPAAFKVARGRQSATPRSFELVISSVDANGPMNASQSHSWHVGRQTIGLELLKTLTSVLGWSEGRVSKEAARSAVELYVAICIVAPGPELGGNNASSRKLSDDMAEHRLPRYGLML